MGVQAQWVGGQREGPGGAFARGRGRLAGPLVGRLSGPTFLLAPEEGAATIATPTVQVVEPCGERSGGCGGGGDRSTAAGGAVTRGLVMVGGFVMVGGDVTIGVGALGGGHLGRRALDHLWLASM